MRSASRLSPALSRARGLSSSSAVPDDRASSARPPPSGRSAPPLVDSESGEHEPATQQASTSSPRCNGSRAGKMNPALVIGGMLPCDPSHRSVKTRELVAGESTESEIVAARLRRAGSPDEAHTERGCAPRTALGRPVRPPCLSSPASNAHDDGPGPSTEEGPPL